MAMSIFPLKALAEKNRSSNHIEAIKHCARFVFSSAYAFLAASYLSGDPVKKFHDLIEDVIAQADEVDEKFLQVKQVYSLCFVSVLLFINGTHCLQVFVSTV